MNSSIKDSNLIVDIHSHPTLRAFNTPFTSGSRNIWERTHNEDFNTPISRWARLKSREISKQSQANLSCYAAAGARIVFDSLYPVEKGFLNFRRLPSMIMGKEGADQVLRTVTGIDSHQLHALRRSNDYFQELVSQYSFLAQGQGASPCGNHNYQLAGNWSEVEQILKADQHTIAVIVNIEGAHAFNCGLPQRKGYSAANEKEVIENIRTVKSWRYAPFSVNLAHHFYNELAGHCRSFKPGVYQAFNQKQGIGEGISQLGEKVVYELLSKQNGRRILIDIKHLSVRSRKEYYRMLEMHNHLNPNDRIPVMCSHTGMNDFETLKDLKRKKDKPRKSKKSAFHNWGINLCAEEIRLIHDTGGIVGLMVDKGLLGSFETLQNIQGIPDATHRKDGFMELVASNIFKAVASVGKASAWDILAIGTDYDGLITHMDDYPDAASLPQLRHDLQDFIERKRYGESLWFGMEPAELITKIMSGNALGFLSRNF